MFLKQNNNVELEIKGLEKALIIIKFKCWYYEEASKDGNEQRAKNITIEQMPDDIKRYYKELHH